MYVHHTFQNIHTPLRMLKTEPHPITTSLQKEKMSTKRKVLLRATFIGVQSNMRQHDFATKALTWQSVTVLNVH